MEVNPLRADLCTLNICHRRASSNSGHFTSLFYCRHWVSLAIVILNNDADVLL